jgi:hypothetical protein
MKHHNFDEQGELRDIFAGLAMQVLIEQVYGSGVTTKWVTNQAYKYADAMLEQRNQVSHNEENNK